MLWWFQGKYGYGTDFSTNTLNQVDRLFIVCLGMDLLWKGVIFMKVMDVPSYVYTRHVSVFWVVFRLCRIANLMKLGFFYVCGIFTTKYI